MKENFQTFNTEHGLLLLILVVCTALLIMMAKRLRASQEFFLRMILCAVVWGQEIALYSYRVSDGSLQLAEHLPLHMCSLSVLLIPIMLYKKHRSLFVVLYFWGMGGATQALLTPTVDANTTTFLFYQFFLSHSLIVAGVLYPIFVFSFRLQLHDVWKAIKATLLLLPCVGVVNWAVGGNYFYLAHKPDADTLLNVLGPWPVYIAPLILVGVLIFGILYLPFPLLRFLRTKQQPA